MTQLPELARGAEFELIRGALAGLALASPEVRVGPGDDCAILRSGVALTCDASVEGVHFRTDWITLEEAGYRACAAAISDLAAVAAEPVGVLLAIALPRREGARLAELVRGAAAAAADSRCVLLGGDTTAAEAVAVTVTAVGQCTEPVLRSGARAGDEVWVSGALGGAAAAVRDWMRGAPPSAAARSAFAHPRPRIAEARWLRDTGAVNAMIDISDGLVGDASHIARASGVGIELDPASVPLHAALRDTPPAEALDLALAGGEDYELCFAAQAGRIAPLADAFAARFHLPLTRVGTVIEGDGVWRVNANTERTRFRDSGYRHFEG